MDTPSETQEGTAVNVTISLALPPDEVQLLVDLVGAIGLNFNHDFDSGHIKAYIVRQGAPQVGLTFTPEKTIASGVETIDVPVDPARNLVARGLLVPRVTRFNLPDFARYDFKERRGEYYAFGLSYLARDLARDLLEDALKNHRDPGSYTAPADA